MAAYAGCLSCAVQDLLDLRFHRCRQYRPGDGCTAGRFRRYHRAGDAGVSGNRTHRLSGQLVRWCGADKWLRTRGASHVLFKICSTFDSTDAGNIGPVMDALRADSGDTIVLVTPAFPETGRTVYQGNLFVGSVPLNESPLKDHPLNPMHDSNLVRVLARQSRSKVGLVDLAAITRGPDAVRARLAGLAGQGFGAAIVDAVFEPDLETIGTVALDHRLSVGASGIGLGLARALVASG